MNIKVFNCCGSNEWLLSRSEARTVVRGFRQDLEEGLIDWTMIFGFCISCGGVFTFFDACRQKGDDFAIAFYNQQMNRSNAQSFAHKIRKHGGPSKKLLTTLERDERVDVNTMIRFHEKRSVAVSKMKKVREE